GIPACPPFLLLMTRCTTSVISSTGSTSVRMRLNSPSFSSLRTNSRKSAYATVLSCPAELYHDPRPYPPLPSSPATNQVSPQTTIIKYYESPVGAQHAATQLARTSDLSRFSSFCPSHVLVVSGNPLLAAAGPGIK